jgi:large subunit ribosomal protein L37e
MTKGTPSFGHSGKHTHIICRRCGKRAYHVRKKVCASCGFGATAKRRKYTYLKKK